MAKKKPAAFEEESVEPTTVLVRATKEGFNGQGVVMPGEKFFMPVDQVDRCSWVERVDETPERTASPGGMGRPVLDDVTPKPATEDEWADLGRATGDPY